MTQILQAINGTKSGDTTPTIGNTPQCPHKMSRPMLSPASNMIPMNIDQPNQADVNLNQNPPASHANHKYDGSNVSASVHK